MWRYYLFRVAGVTIAYLPKKIGYLIALIVADTVYALSPRLRNTIADNMRHVMGPEADNASINKAARAVLRNAAKNYFDFIKLPHIKHSNIESFMVTHNWHNFEEAFKKGKGVICVTAHLGSFDTAVQYFAAKSVKVTVLVEPLKPPALLNYVTKLRGGNGIKFVPAGIGSLEIMLRALRHGEVVLLVCDRDITGNGLESDFFGDETTLPTAAVRIAMKTGAIIVPTFNLRRGDGRYDAFFEPAIDIIHSGDRALENNLEKVTSILEKYIKICPEQWVVLSPVWGNKQ